MYFSGFVIVEKATHSCESTSKLTINQGVRELIARHQAYSAIISHMLNEPEKPPIWVDRYEQLKLMAVDLANHPLISVDTESNSLYVYHEQVCLIQFSTGETDYLLDPFSLPDLSILGSIFANPNIEKIFHASEYDLICLKRDFHFTFKNIFDTMMAGRILGRTAIGLGSMIEEEFGIVLDKRYQRANWGMRPLSKAALAYARLDTFYLIPLRSRLITALQDCERWDLAVEDFKRMCSVSASNNDNGNHTTWKIPGSQNLNPQQAAVLQELCRYRDMQAQKQDLPPFKILGNQVLVDLALTCPQSRDELINLGKLSRFQKERHASGLVQAVQRGLQEKPYYRPSTPHPDDAYLLRLDAPKTWRKSAAKTMEVESDVILPRETMEAIASSNPQTIEELNRIMGHLPWRMEQFGEKILKIITKQKRA
jgi:ribonuclease D